MKEPINITAPIGVIVVAKANININNSNLRLFSESGCDEGAYYPAQDIYIYGDKQIEALRDFCVQILKEREAYKT